MRDLKANSSLVTVSRVSGVRINSRLPNTSFLLFYCGTVMCVIICLEHSFFPVSSRVNPHIWTYLTNSFYLSSGSRGPLCTSTWPLRFFLLTCLFKRLSLQHMGFTFESPVTRLEQAPCLQLRRHSEHV